MARSPLSVLSTRISFWLWCIDLWIYSFRSVPNRRCAPSTFDLCHSTVRIPPGFRIFDFDQSLYNFIKENETAHPATIKRGGNLDVKHKPERRKAQGCAMERKLEQGLEESMAGSGTVSVTEPSKTKHHEKKEG